MWPWLPGTHSLGTGPHCSPAGRLTERGGQEPVHHDVCEAADGRGEVCVERHVERVVSELLLVLQDPRAEVLRHLGVGVGGT